MLVWDDVRYLLALLRGGSLAAAARALRTDATTVGRRITQLESRLGVRLFDRTSQGFTPTEAALRLAPHAERMEREALALARVAAAEDPRLDGTVHLTTTEAVAARYLTPHLPALRARHPGLELVITCAERRLDLGRREADVALRLVRPSEPDLIARLLLRVELALYASRAYLDGRSRPDATGPELPFAGHDLVAFLGGAASAPENDWLDRHCRGGRVVFRTNSVTTMCEAIAEGTGIGLLPRIVADRDPRLVRLETRPPPNAREIWLAYHEDIEPSPRVRAVIDFLVDTFEGERTNGRAGMARAT